MSSANSESYFFFSNLDSFLFLLWLLWLKLPKLCWIVVVRVGTPCLVPDFRGNAFSFSPLRIMFAVGLIIYGFYYVKLCSFYACFLEGFYHKWVLNFVKDFLCIYWDNHIFLWLSFHVFIFQFVNVVYHNDWFVDIKKILAFLG